ncbi:MAG: pilus assembly protein FimV, partial [Candidatus Contendobacter sp.]
MEVRSALNQTFEAELPLVVNNPAELTGLVVRIPRQEEFDRVGVERLELLSKLRFSVQTSPGGPSFVKVTSLEPIRDPSFNLLLELVWPRGRLIREFVIQLDPELYANRRQPPPPPVVVP